MRIGLPSRCSNTYYTSTLGERVYVPCLPNNWFYCSFAALAFGEGLVSSSMELRGFDSIRCMKNM
jgi:hypothetical protein